MKSLAPLAVLSLVLVSSEAFAAPFTNGSFEQPGVSSVVYLTAGSTFMPGWTVVDSTLGGDNEIAYQNNSAFGGLGVVASDGTHFLDMTGVVGRGKGVKSDAIDTVTGAKYRVGVDVGAFFVRGQGSFGDSIVDLLVNDLAVASFTNTQDLVAPGSDWKRFTYDFTAVGPSARLTFLASTSTASSNLGVGLDHVTFDAISAAPSAAPEPAAWGLMILGFGGAGAVVRRRRRLAA